MLDQHTINLLERLVIAEEQKAKELKEINSHLADIVYVIDSKKMYEE